MPKYRNSEYTVEFNYRRLFQPRDERELIEFVKNNYQEGRRLKVKGGSHTFSNITTTDDTLVDLSFMNDYRSIIKVDNNKKQVTLGAGMQLGDSIEALNDLGFHYSSIGSWYQQKLGGVIATAVHGSSMAHGSLSDIVVGLEAILADGTKIKLENEEEDLKAWRVNLGQLGIVTKITFQLQKPFYLHCQTKDIEDDREGFNHLFEILDRWDQQKDPYVSHLWLPYFGKNGRTLTRILRYTSATRPNQAAIDYENKWSERDGNIVVNAAEDRGMYLLGKSFVQHPKLMKNLWSGAMANAFLDDQETIDRSFRVFMYDQYREPTENHWMRMIMNAEYALDVRELESVFYEVRELLRIHLEKGQVINLPRLHFRFGAPSENTLLGMNAQRRTVYIGHYPSAAVIHKRQIPLFRAIEKIFDLHGGRPHWGKCRYLGQNDSFKNTYNGNWEKFMDYREQVDPRGIFSDGINMFKNINLFENEKLIHKPFSGLDSRNYFPIRYLGGRSRDVF